MTKSATTTTNINNNDFSNQGSAAGGGKCPVDHKNRSLWNVLGISSKDQNQQKQPDDSLMPASLEEAARYAQTPQPDQRLPLATHRAKSSIPRGESQEADNNPHHQIGFSKEASPTWVYPSEQQVFNAMKRKGWQGIEEESIPSFLQIHNSVNERSWRYLQSWETNKDITLVKFQGRPNELSPKGLAWSLLGYPPFDRHDWYVDNGSESSKRYVLDFYMKEEDPRTGLPRVDIDVRPALDTPSAGIARIQRFVSELFPGIATEIQRFQQQQSSSQSPPKHTS